MRKWILFGLLLVAAVAIAEDDEVPECDPEVCRLPECRCSGTDIPGGLAPRDVPQFVTVSFDDAVNVRNIENYRSLLYGRRNSNNCPAGFTFYVSHEYTDYTLVNELYNNGFEIGLNSITHQTPQTYWAQATYETLVKEFADQKILMSHFAQIPINTFQGLRLPFLQMNGNASFKMMADHDILYDNSWPTTVFTNPALWPYTLHYKSTQDCVVPPCPNASIPGPWVMPMIAWTDLNNTPCTFVEACFHHPDHDDEQGWYEFILRNFERHYRANRAPFPFYVHDWFLEVNPAVRSAFKRFLNLINNMNDVFLVNAAEVVEWVKNPVPINVYRSRACKSFTPTFCRAFTCPQLPGLHNNMTYYMQGCAPCPDVYPWLGNPLGRRPEE